MTKTSFNKLMLTASSLGIISLMAVPQASAGTITITPEGTIYVQETPKVLGKLSSPQLETTETNTNKVKLTNEAKKVEVKTTQDNKVRLQTAPTEKTVAAPLAEEDELVFVQKVATSEAKTRITSKNQNKYMITNGIAAKVGTPLSFNLETNEMTVTTKNGTKVVAVLPDAALAKARLEANVEVPPLEDTSEDIDETGQVTLMDYQDSPTYAVKGKSKKKLLGIIPVELDKTVYVSAVSGNVVDTQQTLVDQFLDLISF